MPFTKRSAASGSCGSATAVPPLHGCSSSSGSSSSCCSSSSSSSNCSSIFSSSSSCSSNSSSSSGGNGGSAGRGSTGTGSGNCSSSSAGSCNSSASGGGSTKISSGTGGSCGRSLGCGSGGSRSSVTCSGRGPPLCLGGTGISFFSPHSPQTLSSHQRKFSFFEYATSLVSRPLFLAVLILLSCYMPHLGMPLAPSSHSGSHLISTSPHFPSTHHPSSVSHTEVTVSGFHGRSLLGRWGGDSYAFALGTTRPTLATASSGDGDAESAAEDARLVASAAAAGANAGAGSPSSVALSRGSAQTGEDLSPKETAPELSLLTAVGRQRRRPEGATEAPTAEAVGSEEWRMAVPRHPLCKKLFPLNLLKPSRGPISFVGDLVGDRRSERVLLIFPRHGLGNSLRGYVSAFVYAALSGRRLVRFHGAEHAKVFDTLCQSFHCGFDAIESENPATGGPMAVHKQLEKLRPVDLNSKFRDSEEVLGSFRATRPLFVTKRPHLWDGFWRRFPMVRACVLAALHCDSTWCVHSHALRALIGPPTQLLRRVVDSVLLRHVGPDEEPVHATGPAASAPAATPSGGADAGASRWLGMLRSVGDHSGASGVRREPGAVEDAGSIRFDVAVHFRTRPKAIESKHPDHEAQPGEEMMKTGCVGNDQGTEGGSQFLKSCLWDCLGSVLLRLQQEKQQRLLQQQQGGREQQGSLGARSLWGSWRANEQEEAKATKETQLRILLATDNGGLRSAFIDRLAQFGSVFYSSGVIVHSSKSESLQEERLPTMAEFYLMSRADMIVEAGSYLSTFAYFSGLLGNTTLASLEWLAEGGCGLKVAHQKEGDSELLATV